MRTLPQRDAHRGFDRPIGRNADADPDRQGYTHSVGMLRPLGKPRALPEPHGDSYANAHPDADSGHNPDANAHSDAPALHELGHVRRLVRGLPLRRRRDHLVPAHDDQRSVRHDHGLRHRMVRRGNANVDRLHFDPGIPHGRRSMRFRIDAHAEPRSHAVTATADPDPISNGNSLPK